MGSLSVQPPSGLTRNLTEVFVFLRNNAQQNHIQVEFETNDDKAGLISLNEDSGCASFGNKTPPSWVNVLDEVNYEMTRIKTRKATLKDLQQRHLVDLNFNDENGSPEQEKIKDLTDEITSMFTHCRRLIRLLEESEQDRTRSYTNLKENVIASLMIALNNLLQNFRSNQSIYLKNLDSRQSNVENFFLAASSTSNTTVEPMLAYGGAAADNGESWDLGGGFEAQNETNEELTIDQIQHIMQNEHMTKEREKEVIKISKSILELNSLFKDISGLILDQGTILDRIDYNVERSVLRIKSAYESVQKAEKYQGNGKLKLILVLAGIAIFLMLLILLTKL